MIEIKNVATERAKECVASCGVQADCVMEMTERGERLGICCYTLNGETVTLVYLQAPDTALVDALLRATLNSARAAGAKTALITDKFLQNHMMNKKYFDAETDMQVEIAEFFSKTACKG